MTSTPFPSGASDTDEHPEVAEISALSEGLLPPSRSSDVRAHLADCPLCEDVRTSLVEIRDALGTLPGPQAMPADIAGRIDAALAAEALLDSTSTTHAEQAPEAEMRDEEPASAVSRETAPSEAVSRTASPRETPGLSAREEHPVSRETGDRPPGRPRAATGPGRDNPARRPRRRRSVLLSAVALVGVIAVGGVVTQALTGSGTNTTAEKPEEAALKKQVHSLLESPKAAKSSGPEINTKQSPSSPDETPLPGSATTVPSCIQAGIDGVRDRGGASDETPLATDEKARYKDGTGYLVVLPHPGDKQRADVYVIDGSCVSQDTPKPAEVLLQRTYPRN